MRHCWKGMKRSATYFLLLLIAALFPGVPAIGESAHALRDIDGVVHGSLEQPSGWKWTLLFFLMSDCPIANQYAPEIQRICDSYGPKGAKCFLVYVDSSMKAADIRKHMQDYKYTGLSAILDGKHELVQKAGATVVSEVAVFAAGADLKYRGRIDDLYAGLGKQRRVVTRHDLRDSLDALLAGKGVPSPVTQAYGCFIP
jgi:AhpC/TSA family